MKVARSQDAASKTTTFFEITRKMSSTELIFHFSLTSISMSKLDLKTDFDKDDPMV